MHLYFINYFRFQESSGIHIHFLANELVRMGIPCTACVPDSPEKANDFGEVSYSVTTHARLVARAVLSPSSFRKERAVFCAWTPREKVRRVVRFLSGRTKRPYFVHLEDNEELLFEKHTGRSAADGSGSRILDCLLLPTSLIRPRHYRQFMRGAAGVSCIMDSLEQFVPQGVPRQTFWPSCEKEFFALTEDSGRDLRKRLAIDDKLVITYTGNTHAANVDEISTLYEAVCLLNADGYAVHLLRCGGRYAQLDPAVERDSAPYVTEMGSLPPPALAEYIAAADILVQPGKAGAFNDYRFPSKLPMFLASGRPVVMPRSNIGRYLSDGDHCLLLGDGTARELARLLAGLADDPDRRRRIGQAGREFAKNNFSWKKSAETLASFYADHAS